MDLATTAHALLPLTYVAPIPSAITLPSPILPACFYSKALKPLQCDHYTEMYISVLEKEAATLHQENTKLAAHAILAFDHVQGLKTT